ncbi:MAG: DUF5610 domain-containing protein [Gammaproteobacteria bacterium]|nr:DUF5610 domain-containing protein [Gammaproteobacteria bacterium]
MNINPVKNSANHQIKQDKDREVIKSKSQSDAVAKTRGAQDPVTVTFDTNQKLMIGAKTLLASLNQQLSIDSSFSYELHSSKTINIQEGKGANLDIIEIKPFEFDFEAVAKNVMDFVSGIIIGAQASGASDDKLNELLSQARSGIDQGFSQARDELKGFDIYTKELEQGIDKSYQLIQDSMTDLEQQLFSPQVSSINVSEQQLDLFEDEQASIAITTKDGDEININFSRFTSLSQRQSIVDGENSKNIEFNQYQSFSFQVEGTLDKEELKAVSNLIKDITKLADKFFNGDVEKAWQQAQELGFDDQQIAQFSFDFKEVKQISVIEHYSQGSKDSPIATLAPYAKDLAAIFKQSDALFEGENLKKLMNDVAQQQIELMDGLVTVNKAQNFNDFNQRFLNS